MNQSDRFVGVFAIICLVLALAGLTWIALSPKGINIGSNNILNIFDRQEKIYLKIRAAFDLKDYNGAQSTMAEYFSDYPDGKYKNKIQILAASVFLQKKDFETSRLYLDRVLSDTALLPDDQLSAALVIGKLAKEKELNDPVALNFIQDSYLKADDKIKGELAAYIGYLYLFQNNLDEALRYFNLATGEYGIIGKARVYIQEGKYQQAIQEYLNYFSVYAQNDRYGNVRDAFIKQTMFYAGQLHTAGKDAEAVNYYLKIDDIFPKENSADDALLAAADIYLSHKENSGALSLYTKAANNASTNRDDAAIYQKSALLYQMNRKKEAAIGFKELKEKYPYSTYAFKASEWLDVISEN